MIATKKPFFKKQRWDSWSDFLLTTQGETLQWKKSSSFSSHLFPLWKAPNKATWYVCSQYSLNRSTQSLHSQAKTLQIHTKAANTSPFPSILPCIPASLSRKGIQMFLYLQTCIYFNLSEKTVVTSRAPQSTHWRSRSGV